MEELNKKIDELELLIKEQTLLIDDIERSVKELAQDPNNMVELLAVIIKLDTIGRNNGKKVEKL